MPSISRGAFGLRRARRLPRIPPRWPGERSCTKSSRTSRPRMQECGRPREPRHRAALRRTRRASAGRLAPRPRPGRCHAPRRARQSEVGLAHAGHAYEWDAAVQRWRRQQLVGHGRAPHMIVRTHPIQRHDHRVGVLLISRRKASAKTSVPTRVFKANRKGAVACSKASATC